MNNYAELIKNKLENVLDNIEKDYQLFVKNPEKDFSRKRKLSFKEVLKMILSLEGNSLNHELLKYFSFDSEHPTTSAFVQQRDKILPEAFETIFRDFTDSLDKPKKYKGHRLLAADGTCLSIAYNPKDEKTYIPNGNVKGFNNLHMNALFDISNKIWVNIFVQNGREKSERKALIHMVKNLNVNEKTIIIADRGYENYDVIEHIKQKGMNFLIRIKDVNSNGISSGLNLPKEQVFDEEISFLLTRRNTNQIKANSDKYKFMPKNQNFDFLLPENKGTYPMSFRIVRFPIGKNSYEVLMTNLDKSEFSIDDLKEIYHMRWGIETAFRELKYAIGLTSFHSKKVEYIKQEIFAKLTMYNFCETITLNVVLQKKERKHVYQVNFTVAISICLQYFKSKPDILPINVEALIQKHVLPVRLGRKDPRKVKTKSSVSFLYRVA